MTRPRMLRHQFFYHLSAAIGRAVVNDDHLRHGPGLPQHRLDGPPEVASVVVVRHEDRDVHSFLMPRHDIATVEPSLGGNVRVSFEPQPAEHLMQVAPLGGMRQRSRRVIRRGVLDNADAGHAAPRNRDLVQCAAACVRATASTPNAASGRPRCTAHLRHNTRNRARSASRFFVAHCSRVRGGGRWLLSNSDAWTISNPAARSWAHKSVSSYPYSIDSSKVAASNARRGRTLQLRQMFSSGSPRPQAAAEVAQKSRVRRRHPAACRPPSRRR